MSDRLYIAMRKSVIDFVPVMIAMGVCSLVEGWADDNGFTAIKRAFALAGFGLSIYGIYVLISGPWRAIRAK